jgi:glycine cleavage system H protein
MAKWKAVRVKQELLDQVKQEVKKNEYKGLSEFVSEAIQLRLQTLTKQRVTEYLERDRATRTPLMQEQIFYTPKHVWAQITPNGEVAIGITAQFRDQLKDIVNIRTDLVGQEVFKDEPFGVAESWWFTQDMYSPLSGKITAVNKQVIENPFALNADSSQWIVKIQPENKEALSWIDDLLSAERYQNLVTKATAA